MTLDDLGQIAPRPFQQIEARLRRQRAFPRLDEPRGLDQQAVGVGIVIRQRRSTEQADEAERDQAPDYTHRRSLDEGAVMVIKIAVWIFGRDSTDY